MISQKTIDDVRTRANIVEVVGEVVQLKQQGANFGGLCPFHNEKTPSFNVRPDDGYYHCFGCGVSGDVISFVMEHQGLSFPDAVELLARRFNIDIKREGISSSDKSKKPSRRKLIQEINLLALHFFRAELKKNEIARAYLNSRGLSEECLNEFNVGFAPPQWRALVPGLKQRKFTENDIVASGLARKSSKGELYDVFRGRIIFPVFTQRGVVGGFGGRIIPELQSEQTGGEAPKYLNSPETELYQKSKVLFGLQRALTDIRQEKSVFLVEGYLDVMSLWQSGVSNVVATCGTAVTSSHVSRLANLAKKVYVLFDGDDAGRHAAGKSFRVFLNSGVDAVAIFCPEGEDPDTLAQEHGKNVREYLFGLEQKGLIDCYIDSLLKQFGLGETGSLGAAAKGKVSEQLARVLAEVENGVERAELIRQGAFRLRTKEELLARMVEQPDRKISLAPKEQESSEEHSEPIESTESVLPVNKLPRVDQELLLVLMAKREKYIDQVLKESKLTHGLHSSTLLFLQGLQEILSSSSDNDGEQKEQVRVLLKRFGASWVQHWRRAHEMLERSELNTDQTFRDCANSLRRTHVAKSIRELEVQMREEPDQTQRAALSQRKLQLERLLRSGTSKAFSENS